jgi:KaiC/GvpD/RAD55 family RecA-like ATPase
MPTTAIERQNRSGQEPERLDTAIEHGVNIPLTMKNIQNENSENEDFTSLMAMEREKEQEFLQSEAAKLSKLTDILIDSAIEVVQSRKNYMLDDRDILFFDAISNEFITVEQVLNAGEKYHFKDFLEPLSSKSMVTSQEFSGVKKTCRFKWNVAYPIIT